MKKALYYMIALIFAGSLTVAGTSTAALFGSDKKEKEQAEAPAETAAPKEDSTAVQENAQPSGEEVALSGSIDDMNRFIAENGQTYRLSDNEQGLEVQSLAGKKVEIKGTVMEEEGQKTVEVTDYTILE